MSMWTDKFLFLNDFFIDIKSLKKINFIYDVLIPMLIIIIYSIIF